jgi:predicted HTH domain antitoxin
MSHTLQLEVDDEILAALRQEPAAYVAELQLAAAVKMYELGRVSQERAAHIAGLTRRNFLFALSRYQVTPYQTTVDELREELARG